MKAVLIDDEPLPLLQLTKMLQARHAEIEVAAAYRDPAQALRDMPALAPDVVFVDIQMPEVSGLELAAAVQAMFPAAEIVFVTAYDRYAVQAFELFALDYVMKPVRPDRLDKTLERLKARLPDKAAPDRQPAATGAMLRFFQRITVELPGREREPIRWRTAKAQELFAYLFHHLGRFVPRETLVDLLWADFEPERGAQHLYTTIYHVRRAMQTAGLGALSLIGQQHQGGYSLQADGGLRCDVREWEQRVKGMPEPRADTIAAYEALLDEYDGDYLADYDYLWAAAEQERLRRLWLDLAQTVGSFHMRSGNTQAAILLHRRVQQRYPLEEESYWELMKLYAALRHPIAVEEQYRLLAATLERELDVRPSDVITSWYMKWKEQTTA